MTGNLLIVEEIVSRKVLIMFSVGLGILYSFCTFAMLFMIYEMFTLSV